MPEFEQTAEHFRKAAESVEKAASQVEAHVAGGIQPDVRELRLHVSEIQETANRRMKRLEWGLTALAILNGAVLFFVVAQ